MLRAIVRPPAINFAEGLTTSKYGAPVYDIALKQHEDYCQALEHCGLTLTRLEADPRYPDSTFVEDTAVLTDGRAIVSRSGEPSRAGEVDEMKVVLARFFAEVRAITGSGTLDGGDICQSGVDGKHFFIGISARTNHDGAQQLASFLDQMGYTHAFVDIRHISGLLHLKSGLASVAEGRLVVIEELTHHEAFQSFDLIPVAPAEAYAANCIQANGCVLIAEGYPAFAQTLTELGYDIVPLDMSEFQKMDGGLSCLSLRF